jgi:hypothetical protein
MVKAASLLLLLVLGAVVLCPVIMAVGPDPLPGDFTLAWNDQKIPVPLVWSLCASAALTLLYSLYRR